MGELEKWENIDLAKAIKHKLPEWYGVCDSYNPPGPDRVTFLKEEHCPQCGFETLYCIRNDFGHVDYEPKFAHICTNGVCSYVVKDSAYGGLGDLETTPYYCPWCGVSKIESLMRENKK